MPRTRLDSAGNPSPLRPRRAHNGRMWKAKWWTRNEEPGTTGQWGGWQDEGAC
ncbi:carbohydrate-binding protein [Streptomyces sp. NBC_00224]|uniref:Carbohydrate-binding protein n=1 Tax=Streptomyces sp. NBC_00060 TaxID=2975636 RepID=A0AAU2GVA6_9ACTN